MTEYQKHVVTTISDHPSLWRGELESETYEHLWNGMGAGLKFVLATDVACKVE